MKNSYQQSCEKKMHAHSNQVITSEHMKQRFGASLNIQLANKTIPSGAHVHVQLRRPDSFPFGFKRIRFCEALVESLPSFFFFTVNQQNEGGHRVWQVTTLQRCRGANDARLSHFIRDWTTTHRQDDQSITKPVTAHMLRPHSCLIDEKHLLIWMLGTKQSFELHDDGLLHLNDGLNQSAQWMDG